MKTVGKQLQEARLAKNWTPELAARETKIKIERLRDLETDDYSHFSSPTYARGFVRTYARSLGLDEYTILRQLDNKLPDDDTANIATDGGVAYLPETSMPPRAAHRDYTGLYIVMGLGAAVTLAIVVVLFEAYRVGELPDYFTGAGSSTTNSTSEATASTAPPARALPVDSDTPPPIPEVKTNAPAATAADTTSTPAAPRALPVDPSELTAANNATPTPVADTTKAPRALPVDPSQLNSPPPADTPPPAAAPPRALPVTAAELAADSPSTPSSQPANPPPENSPASNSTGPTVTPPADPGPPIPVPVPGKPSNAGPVMEPSMPAVQPAPSASTSSTGGDRRLVLTASQDSFVRVTDLDSPDNGKPLYSAVLRSGQSVGFDGHKFSINVGVPSAVDIRLDGVNYGPHSDHSMPETFNVESHLP